MIAVDLFAGAGGSSTGATAGGARVTYAVNHWSIAIETHRRNRPATTHLLSRVDQVDPRPLGHIDLLMASPGAPGHAMNSPAPRPGRSCGSRTWHLSARPRWLVVENVPDFIAWPVYPAWAEALRILGYHLRTKILTASDYGVPQARCRRFAVAPHDGDVPDFARPTNPHPATAVDVIDWSAAYPLTPVATKARRTRERVEQGRAHAGRAPFLIVYYGTGPTWQSLDRPLRPVTTRGRFALVVDTPAGPMMPMLQPSELGRAMSFPEGYRLAGKRHEQVIQLGNAGPPRVMETIVRDIRLANTSSAASPDHLSAVTQPGRGALLYPTPRRPSRLTH